MAFFPKRTGRLPPDVEDELLRDAALISPHGVAQGLRFTSPHLSVIDRLAETRVPTLLVNGKREKRFQPLRDKRGEGLFEGLRIVDLEGGHPVNLDCPDEFVAAVRDLPRTRCPLNATSVKCDRRGVAFSGRPAHPYGRCPRDETRATKALDQFDYVIVVAGSAGCVLANRLSADTKTRVLLLEAGPEPKDPWIKIPAGMARLFKPGPHNWGYFTEPQAELNGRRIYWPRGKGLGGSSAINGMLYVRGHPLDYEHWRQLGNPWLGVLGRHPAAVQACRRAAPGRRKRFPTVAAASWRCAIPSCTTASPTSSSRRPAARGHAHNTDFNDGEQDGVRLSAVHHQKRRAAFELRGPSSNRCVIGPI